MSSDVKIGRISPLVTFISACFVLNSGVIIINCPELLFISGSLTLNFNFPHRAEKTEVLSEDLLQVTKLSIFKMSCLKACQKKKKSIGES